MDRGDTRSFEQDAEMLVVYQLDLLAQLERQIRAVHHAMRHIEKLRGVKARVGTELSNGQRDKALTNLSEDIAQLDAQLDEEHSCCADMQSIIARWPPDSPTCADASLNTTPRTNAPSQSVR